MPAITHVALWTRDLEASRAFYEGFFGGTVGEMYHNPNRQFTSYFLVFEDETRLELMSVPKLADASEIPQIGWAHIAFRVGSREKVNALTEFIRQAGYTVASEPRTTGDGYYESVVQDPDGNLVEITV
jgi:lactoylglutathione lyase